MNSPNDDRAIDDSQNNEGELVSNAHATVASEIEQDDNLTNFQRWEAEFLSFITNHQSKIKFVGYSLLVSSVLFVAMFFFRRAKESLGDTDFTNPFLIAAVVWPIVFAILEAIFTDIVEGPKRKGDQKYMIQHEGGREENFLKLEELKEKITGSSVKDINILSSSFWETSMAINLSIAALSTTVVNIFLLLSTDTLETIEIDLLQTAFYVLALQFAALAILAQILKSSNSEESALRRILISQITNVVGIVVLFVSFLLLVGIS